eukprot:jgi/Mesen1/7785/ME000408S06897
MSSSADAEDLPRTNVRRIVRAKLAELQKSKTASAFTVNKDALIAFSEAAKIFIHYLSAAANEICHESKRQTISADDVLKATEDLDFPEFLEPLKVLLEGFREESKVKKTEARRKSQGKKRKAEEDALEAAREGNAVEDAEDDDAQDAEGAGRADGEPDGDDAADEEEDAAQGS